MEIAIIIIMSIMLVAFLILKIGDVFAPWTITTTIWLVILVLFQFQGNLLYPLGNQFYNCLMLWVPIFCCSSLITYYVMPGHGDTQKNSSSIPEINHTLFTVFYVISMVITPLYLYEIMQTVMMFDTADMLYNLRILAVHGDESHGFLNYSYVLNQVLLVVALWQYPKVPMWQLVTIIIASIMSAFAIMEKGMVFFLFAAVIFTLYEKKFIRMRSIIFSAISIVILFFLI
ncbi:MAG: oligosaccharide repeat unit polymerase, partial [Prevotella sp.]|nr:oligosaccharide repeat unit polymerase [Prevotella sp.]